MAITDAPSYERLLEQAGRLEPADQLRLLEGLAALLRRQIGASPTHRVTDLRGLGKEIWRGIDAQDYIQRERDSWDG